MTTSCPCFAAAIPPAVPRHDITVAFGASPPSRISSQPTSRRPFAFRNRSIRRMNQLCSSSSSRSFSRAMIACASGLSFQRFLGASSPPMWMYVLREGLDVFPSEYIHIGGGGAPKKRWKESPEGRADTARAEGQDGDEGQRR